MENNYALGTKENPHPITPKPKDRIIGHYYIYKGELRKNIFVKGKNGSLRKQEQTNKRKKIWRENWTREKFIEEKIKECYRRHNDRVKKGRKFDNETNITVEDILKLIEKQSNKCRLTGIELIWKINSGKHMATIDRIDSNKTYTKDNVQLLCWWANQAKMNDTDEDMINYCKMVAEHNK